jgi:hypothetical protein
VSRIEGAAIESAGITTLADLLSARWVVRPVHVPRTTATTTNSPSGAHGANGVDGVAGPAGTDLEDDDALRPRWDGQFAAVVTAHLGGETLHKIKPDTRSLRAVKWGELDGSRLRLKVDEHSMQSRDCLADYAITQSCLVHRCRAPPFAFDLVTPGRSVVHMQVRGAPTAL